MKRYIAWLIFQEWLVAEEKSLIRMGAVLGNTGHVLMQLTHALIIFFSRSKNKHQKKLPFAQDNPSNSYTYKIAEINYFTVYKSGVARHAKGSGPDTEVTRMDLILANKYLDEESLGPSIS